MALAAPSPYPARLAVRLAGASCSGSGAGARAAVRGVVWSVDDQSGLVQVLVPPPEFGGSLSGVPWQEKWSFENGSSDERQTRALVFKIVDVESCAPVDAEGDPLLEWWLMMKDEARRFALNQAEAPVGTPHAEACDALETAARATRALGLDAIVAADGASVEVAGGVAYLRRQGPDVAVDCAHADLRARLEFELLGVPLPLPPSSVVKERDTTASQAPAKKPSGSSIAKSRRGGAHQSGNRSRGGGKSSPALSHPPGKQQRWPPSSSEQPQLPQLPQLPQQPQPQRHQQQDQHEKEQTPEHELGVLRHVGTIELASGGSTFVTEVALAKVSQYYRPTGKSTSNKANLVPAQFADVPRHYFTQRYRFFSRFDKGIQMDGESWHSVTPEAIAEHIAERCRAGVVLDAFAGCGGNAIQFAYTCERVIAVEIDPSRLAMARNNAEVYGVADRIEFILGDSVRLLRALADKGSGAHAVVDCIFLSPPWGGPEYQQVETFDLRSIKVGGIDGCELFSLATRVSPNVAYFVPRNTEPKAAAELLMAGNAGRLEFERHVVDSRVKTCCIYSGDLLAMRTLGLQSSESSAEGHFANDDDDDEREDPDCCEELVCDGGV
jgi:trimethylguanosine synthase